MTGRWGGTVLVAVVLGLAACGGDDEEEAAATPTPTPTETAAPTETATEDEGGGGEDEGGAGESEIKLSSPADGSLRFDRTELQARTGSVRIEYENPSQVPHAVEVEYDGQEAETEVITNDDASLSVELEPGEYVFYCPVGNHRQAGMEGTLTVE